MEKPKKTWKRELAFLVFLWVVYLSVWGDLQALGLVVVPSFTFIGLAFGMDWYNKADNVAIGKTSRKDGEVTEEDNKEEDLKGGA